MTCRRQQWDIDPALISGGCKRSAGWLRLHASGVHTSPIRRYFCRWWRWTVCVPKCTWETCGWSINLITDSEKVVRKMLGSLEWHITQCDRKKRILWPKKQNKTLIQKSRRNIIARITSRLLRGGKKVKIVETITSREPRCNRMRLKLDIVTALNTVWNDTRQTSWMCLQVAVFPDVTPPFHTAWACALPRPKKVKESA